MPDGDVAILCKDCGTRLDDRGDPPPDGPCPHCGSYSREIRLSEYGHGREGTRLEAREDGARKPWLERTDAPELHRDTQRWQNVHRAINRRDDTYDEVIVDEETGAVLREVHEPLSMHEGRGSARPAYWRLLEPTRLWARTEVVARASPVPDRAGVYAWYFRQL